MNELIGYRVNTSTKPNEGKGVATVFAERNNNEYLGEYGGDSYPIHWDWVDEKNHIRIGFCIAADGVGQASYIHPSLEAKLVELCESEYPNLYGNQETRDSVMLYEFLSTLYGEKFFDDKDAVEYASLCFSEVPQNGFFATCEDNWKKYDTDKDKPKGKNGQAVLPFYRRDSQSLGSRIVCVGLFHKFRKFFIDKEMNEDLATKLKGKIENYLSEELANAIKDSEFFPHDKISEAKNRNYYFLPSTVAMWFYVADENKKSVTALSLNCGDCRTYLFDLNEGVRQISIDDAFEDGTMSAFVHFGIIQRSGDGYSDGKFHLRKVTLDYPCALVACSDGIYDTCPSDKNKCSLAYGDDLHANDFLFELNMQQALRRCYSLEDFRREVVFNFYGQSDTHCNETRIANSYPQIKKDDSGTLVAKFFGTKPTELFEKLRKLQEPQELQKKTFLDRLVEKLNREKLPYYPISKQSNDIECQNLLDDYATGDFRTAIIAQLKAAYSQAVNAMQEAQETTLWGIENAPIDLSGFKLNKLFVLQYLKPMLIKLVNLEEEKAEIGSIFEDIRAIEGINESLKESFDKFFAEYKKLKSSGDSDEVSRYNLFKSVFYGEDRNEFDVKSRDIPEKYSNNQGNNE